MYFLMASSSNSLLLNSLIHRETARPSLVESISKEQWAWSTSSERLSLKNTMQCSTETRIKLE